VVTCCDSGQTNITSATWPPGSHSSARHETSAHRALPFPGRGLCWRCTCRAAARRRGVVGSVWLDRGGAVGQFQRHLTASFHDRSGDFPLGLYWAYSNEFSRAIGLDLAPYLDQSLSATIYPLKEPMPRSLFPYTSARAIILTSHGAIVGAWIDKAGYNASASTLDRRVFTGLVSESWGDWLVASGVVSPTDDLNQQLARLTPEDVIRTYYTAVDDQNFHLAYATLTQQALMDGYLFFSKPDNVLYNESYNDRYWPQNISAAQLQSIQKLPNGPDMEYEAKLWMSFYKPEPTLHGDGFMGGSSS
jgi:hypothetical protein